MSRDRWDRFGWYPSTPKQPPPGHGIKVKRTGATWWGKRWLEALERMSDVYSNRLARGRTYARAGRTHDVVVKAGSVTAKVTGSRAAPYQVTIRLARLPDATWTRAIQSMAAKARFAAELLAGRMPEEIDEAFQAGRASLFPSREADLLTACSCPDWVNPCKHVAATHYVLGEALDRDPFLLFELRGRTREQVLDALRAVRSQGAPAKGKRRAGRSPVRQAGGDRELPGAALKKRVHPADYDRPREALPALHFSFDEPVIHGSVLRQLGAPASWSEAGSPADLLSPLVRAAAEKARRLALAEPEVSVESDLEPEDSARRRRGQGSRKKAKGARRRSVRT